MGIILLTLCYKNNIEIKPSQKDLNYYFRKYKLLLVFRYIGKSFLISSDYAIVVVTTEELSKFLLEYRGE